MLALLRGGCTDQEGEHAGTRREASRKADAWRWSSTGVVSRQLRNDTIGVAEGATTKNHTGIKFASNLSVCGKLRARRPSKDKLL